MEKQTRKGHIISQGQRSNRQISASTVRGSLLTGVPWGTLLGTEVSGMEANGKWQAPRNSCQPAPQAPSAVEAPAACSTLPLGEASCVGSPKDSVPGAGFHLPPHLGHASTHTCMCLSRVHACGTHGIYGAQQRELDRTVTWATGILLGPFLEPQPSQSLLLLAKCKRCSANKTGQILPEKNSKVHSGPSHLPS